MIHNDYLPLTELFNTSNKSLPIIELFTANNHHLPLIKVFTGNNFQLMKLFISKININGSQNLLTINFISLTCDKTTKIALAKV